MFIMGRTRRGFTPEYKDEAVKLVINTGRTVATVARELGLKEATLGRWVHDFRARAAAGAHAITSGAYADNPASAAVSRKVGFTANGTKLELRDNTAAEHHKFILTRERFARADEAVVVDGGAAMRAFTGVPRAHGISEMGTPRS